MIMMPGMDMVKGCRFMQMQRQGTIRILLSAELVAAVRAILQISIWHGYVYMAEKNRYCISLTLNKMIIFLI